MVADSFAVTEPAYLAAQAIFAQNPTVSKVAIGRRALAMTQTLKLTLTDTTVGDLYTFTIVGSDGVSHPVSLVSTGVPATDATSLAALLTFSNIGSAAASSTHVTITQASGKLNDLQNWTSNFQLSDDTADPGLATDLAAIFAADPIGWYGLALDSNSRAEIAAAAAWTESNKRLFSTNNSDAACAAGTTSSANIFFSLKQSAYAKTFCLYSGVQLLDYTGAGMLGNRLPDNPGSDTWAYKTIHGTQADTAASLTETQINNLLAQNGNYYQTVGGINITFPGQSPEGEFVDIARFIDWLQANMQVDVFTLFVANKKVPYTDVGVDQVKNAVKNRLKIGASDAYGGIDGSQPLTVDAPTAETVDKANKSARNLPNVKFSATLAGAIHTTQISGTLTV